MSTPPIDAVMAEIDAWFAERMQQPPISYSVETYNQAHAACADLKQRLSVVITGKAPVVGATDSQSVTATPKADKSAGTKE
jgi:hypothetical protein